MRILLGSIFLWFSLLLLVNFVATEINNVKVPLMIGSMFCFIPGMFLIFYKGKVYNLPTTTTKNGKYDPQGRGTGVANEEKE